MKRSVRELMRQRDLTHFPCVQEGATLEETLEVLRRFDSGSLLVLRGEALVGIYSERDFARQALMRRLRLSLDSRIESQMVRKVVFVTPDYKLEECLAVMNQMHVRHLPVMAEGRVIALLSMRHIMEALIEDREFMIGELVRYVTGSCPKEENAKVRILVNDLSAAETRGSPLAM